jgi:peptide-methionine (R)-S-oxide reductase
MMSSLSTITTTVVGFQASSSSRHLYQRQSQHIAIDSNIIMSLAAAKVTKSEEEWKQVLSPEAYNVLREEGTERPFTSPLNDIKSPGTFSCAGCGAPLFTTSTKYDSGTGWPSFYAPVDGNAIELRTDYKLVLPRTEVICKSCDGHLGHVFDDGPQPTGKRYCMNGVAMKFVDDSEDEALALEVAQRMSESKPVQQPVSSLLSGLAINGVLSALFLNAFISQNKNGGLENVSGNLFDTLLTYLPLVVGAGYAGQALLTLVEYIQSSSQSSSSEEQ